MSVKAIVEMQPQGKRFQDADAYLEATYNPAAESLYLAQYLGSPDSRHDVLAYGNRLYDDTWRQMQSRSLSIAGTDIHEIGIKSRDHQRVVWYWYQMDGHRVTNPITVKLQAWGRLSGDDPRSALVSLSAPVIDGDAQRPRVAFGAFVVNANMARINDLLRGKASVAQ